MSQCKDNEKQVERLRAFSLTINLMLILLLLTSRLLYLYDFPPHLYLAIAGTACIGFVAKMGLFRLIAQEWIA